MALAARLRAVLPEEDAIRDIHTDARLKGPIELLAAFEQKYHLLERARLRLSYQNHFAGRSAVDDSEADKPLRARLAELESDPPLRPIPPRTLPTASAAISRGLQILAGEKIEPAPTIALQIAEIDGQLTDLGRAIAEQREDVDAISGELAAEYGRSLLPAWNAKVIAMFRAFQEASRATTDFREFRARIINAGIRTEILRSPNVSAPLILGDESDNTSQITFWKKTLQTWGLL
jgi:hypothetical protein